MRLLFIIVIFLSNVYCVNSQIKFENLENEINRDAIFFSSEIHIKKSLSFKSVILQINNTQIKVISKENLKGQSSEYFGLWVGESIISSVKIPKKEGDIILKNIELCDNLKIYFIDSNDQMIKLANLTFNNDTSTCPKVGYTTPTSTTIVKPVTQALNSFVFRKGDNILQDAKRLINPKGNPEKEIQELYEIYRFDINSPFFKTVKELKSSINNNGAPGQMGSNISKTDVTNFATGMARFLAERAKQELHEGFFTHMYKEIEKMPELKIYFPQSYAYLKRMHNNTIQLDLEYMKSKFENDMKYLPRNILDAISKSEDTLYPQFTKINKFLREETNGIWINIALQSVMENDAKLNPKDLLYQFVHSEKNIYKKSLLQQLEEKIKQDINTVNLINSIKLVELISNSLLSAEQDRYWITKTELNELLNNEDLFKTYIGLVLAKSEFEEYRIQFNTKSLKQSIEGIYTEGKEVKKDLSNLKNLISALYNNYADVEQHVNALQLELKEQELVEHSYQAFHILKSSIFVVEKLIKNNNVIDDQAVLMDTTVLLNYIDPAVDVAYNLFNKRYNLAIKDFVYLMNLALQNELNSSHKNFISKLNKYGTLIANVANAQSSDEVKAAIEASVLPVGSSRIKRHSDFSLSVNSYVGVFAGKAQYKSFDGIITQKHNVTTAGVLAPIGISLNWKNSLLFTQTPSAFSFNFQLIDLGGLVNFYFQKGDGAQLPNDTKITISDILAPGASISHSIGDSPFSIIAGVQYVNNLSRLPSIETNTDFKPLTWRWHVGIVIDIPLFNLFVKN